MALNADITRLEKNRSANFMLAGVVAAQNPENGRRTHDAVRKICSSIMNAYEVANDSKSNRSEKVAAITAVTDLQSDLDWLLSFAQLETESCRFEDLRSEMDQIVKTLKGQVNVLKTGFRTLRVDVESFSDVFDTLLALLEEITEFFRLGHATECRRVKDALSNAYQESKNLRHCELVALLVDQAKLASTRCNDAWKSVDQLVKIQPGLNDILVPRVDSVDTLLRSSLPELILATKKALTQNGPEGDQERAYKHALVHCLDRRFLAASGVLSTCIPRFVALLPLGLVNVLLYSSLYRSFALPSQITSCIDELGRILDQVSANYVNQFEESATRVPLEQDTLQGAIQGVVKAIAELKGAQMAQEPEMIQMELADAIPDYTKLAISELTKMGATEQDLRDFISAVKKARDGDADDFFEAQKAIEAIVDRVRNKPPPIQIGIVEDKGKSGAKDLLAAAKDMCSAMSKLNLAMDE